MLLLGLPPAIYCSAPSPLFRPHLYTLFINRRADTPARYDYIQENCMGRRFDGILPCGLAAFPLDKIKGAYYIRNPLSIYPNKPSL